jgi:hypothetical protein
MAMKDQVVLLLTTNEPVAYDLTGKGAGELPLSRWNYPRSRINTGFYQRRYFTHA